MFIANREELALKLDVPLKQLTYLLYFKKTENCYRSFEVPKKDGTFRLINTPNDELMTIQKKLSQLLYKKQKEIWEYKNITPNISHGFEKNKTIISNARIHRNKRFVLNLDLEDFFQSFHFGRVMGYFEKNENFDLEHKMAAILAQLTCYKGYLPQGAPTSPIITNLICQILDFKILSISKKYRLDYTRYADDLTFSTNRKEFLSDYDNFFNDIDKIITKAGFKINSKKTRLQYKDSQQMVTGLIVNKKINVNSVYFRTTKAMAHSLYTKNEFYISEKQGTVAQLEGRFSYINSIDKYDNKNIALIKRNFWNLNFREFEFQKFLFYKIFLCNEKPLIITEGKTDIIYIKAALKNNYKDYPDLIEINDEGKFKYKLSFLERSKRLSYFFGISEDGADTINNIYQLYFGGKINGKQCRNYNEIFNRYHTCSTNPTILIYDNEIQNKSKDKPICKADIYKRLTLLEKEQFSKDLRTSKINNSNLYLLTNPLVKDMVECEIEDLFDDNVLNTIVNDRKFDRKVKKGDALHYGKSDFADYIMENYKSINFDNFRPILDNIKNVIIDFNKQK